jgi:photosystem II stability/assembly factor-like uncharacterized protein
MKPTSHGTSVLLLVCALTILATTHAAASWFEIGPFGGAQSLASDATGRMVYLVNPRVGIHRSSAGGPWELVFSFGFPPGFSFGLDSFATRVVVDRATSRVYAATADQLYRSDDDGANWRFLINASITDLNANADVVVISTPQGLMRSTNAGNSWVGILSPLGISQNSVSIVRIDPRAKARLVAVAAGNLFISDDSGNSWRQLLPKNIVAIAIGDLIYVGGPGGVWGCGADCVRISSSGVDNLVFWNRVLLGSASDSLVLFTGSQPVLGPIIQSGLVLSLEATPTVLYAGTTEGVYSTTDGIQWRTRNEGLTNAITAMTIVDQPCFFRPCYKRPGDLVAAAAWQNVLTGSRFWRPADDRLPRHPPLGPNVQALATRTGALYAALPGDGVFLSPSPRSRWQDFSSGLASANLVDMAVDEFKVVVTTFPNGVQSCCADGTWHTLTTYPGLTASAVAVGGQTVVVADGATALISADDGVTWQRSVTLPSPIRRLAITDDRIYAATDVGLFVHRIGAWSLALPGKVNAIAQAFLPFSRLIASVPSGIYFSDDGTRWSFVLDSETLPPNITTVASDGMFVYAGTNSGRIFAGFLRQRGRTVKR